MLPDERHIYVSMRVWHELYPKVDPAPFIYALYEGIDFESYGKGLRKFFLTFIVKKPHNHIHEAGRYYSRKKRALEVAIRLSYNDVTNATPEETFKLLEAAFLEGIDQIGEIKLPEPFDYKAFKKDVAAIFAKEEWYKGYVAAMP